MADLGEELGVSESRISQMRAEALSFLKDGISSQLDEDEGTTPDADTSPRTSRRRQAYRSAVATRSTYSRACPAAVAPCSPRGDFADPRPAKSPLERVWAQNGRMAERERISSGSPFEPTIGFSRAVRVGDTVAVSGTAPVWPDGVVRSRRRGTQARRCLEIIATASEPKRARRWTMSSAPACSSPTRPTPTRWAPLMARSSADPPGGDHGRGRRPPRPSMEGRDRGRRDRRQLTPRGRDEFRRDLRPSLRSVPLREGDPHADARQDADRRPRCDRHLHVRRRRRPCFYGQLFGWTAEEPDRPSSVATSTSRRTACASPVACPTTARAQPGRLVDLPRHRQRRRHRREGRRQRRRRDRSAPCRSRAMDMAVVTDPGGQRSAPGSPRDFAGFGALARANAPGWFELHTRDYDKSVEFYKNVFGWNTHSIGDEPDFRYTTLGEGDDRPPGSWTPRHSSRRRAGRVVGLLRQSPTPTPRWPRSPNSEAQWRSRPRTRPTAGWRAPPTRPARCSSFSDPQAEAVGQRLAVHDVSRCVGRVRATNNERRP